MPTGSLGHGLPIGQRTSHWRPVDRLRLVILGDGELQEGSVWEAAMSRQHLGLSGLTAIVDRNGLQITRATEDTVRLEPLDERWRAFGWAVHEVDGHDLGALRRGARHGAEPAGRRWCIARTVKGHGLPSSRAGCESHFASWANANAPARCAGRGAGAGASRDARHRH